MKHRTLSAAALSAIALLAIPAPAAIQVAMIPHVFPLASGLATHGYLGVDIRDVSDEQISALKLKDTHGAEIIRVDHDGPAGVAGLREHDVILQMNGQAIDGSEQLRRLLRAMPSGQSVTFVISREGQMQTIAAQLENRDDVERRAMARITMPDAGLGTGPNGQAAASTLAPGGSADLGVRSGNSFLSPGQAGSLSHGDRSMVGAMVLRSGYTGAILETMSPQLAQFFGTSTGGGLLVRSVDANSPAESAGLHAGDVVLRVNTAPVNSTGDWLKAIRDTKGKAISVVVLRDKHEQTLSLTPDPHRRSSLEPMLPADMMDPGQINSLVASLGDGAGLFDSHELSELAEKARAQVNSPEFKKQMDELRSKLDSSFFAEQVNSPEFKRQMEDLKTQLNSEAFRQQFDQLHTKIDSPEVKKQMDDLRKQIDRLAKELLAN